MQRLLSALRRRRVFRVAGAYAIGAWLLVQGAAIAFPAFGAPDWALRSVIALVILGFPVTLAIVYALNAPAAGDTRDDAAGPGVAAADVAVAVGLFLVAGAAVFQAIATHDTSPQAERAATDSLDVTDVNAPVPGYQGQSAVAVLPFRNLSDDPGQDYLADALAEDLVTSLYAFKTFPVISSTSSFTYDAASTDFAHIADELGAGYIVHGSVRRNDQRVRITVELVEPDSTQLWSGRYDTTWENSVKVQNEITLKIAKAIEPRIIRSEAERARRLRIEDMRAWDYYLRARALTADSYSWTTVGGEPVTLKTNKKAEKWALKALELDPDSAIVHGLLSHIYGVYLTLLEPYVDEQFAQRALDKSLHHAERARAIDPFEATACSCQAIMYLIEGDHDAALAVTEDALKHNPGSAMIVSGAAKVYQIAGDHERALELIEKAKRLSPRDRAMTVYLAWEAAIRQSLGEFERAAVIARKALLLEPRNHEAYVVRIVSLVALGREEEARRAVSELREHLPDFETQYLWPEPFPRAVRAALGPPLDNALGPNSSYASGVALILDELGWRPSDASRPADAS